MDQDGGGAVDQDELSAFLGKLFPGEGDMYEKAIKINDRRS